VERLIERRAMDVRDLVSKAVVWVVDLDHMIELKVGLGVRRDQNRDLWYRVTDQLCGAFGFNRLC